MKAYDVTGVGLNLGTADEFARKVRRAPCGRAPTTVLAAALRQCCAGFKYVQTLNLYIRNQLRWGVHRWARPSLPAGSRRPTASGWSASSRRAAARMSVHRKAAAGIT